MHHSKLVLRHIGSLTYCFFLLLTSCKSTDVSESSYVTQSEIHQAYYATYNEKDDITTNEAVFRFAGPGGTTLHLTPPSSIKLNDSDMTGQKEMFQGYIYRDTQKGFKDKSRFVFTDTENKTYSNRCRIEGGILTSVPAELSKNAGTRISWEGHLPRGGESLYLQIYPDSGRTISVSPLSDDAHTFLITPSMLSEIPPCKAVMVLERVMETRLNQECNPGGSMTAIFKGKQHTVNINSTPL